MRLSNVAQWARQEVYPRLTLWHLAAVGLVAASAFANFKYGIGMSDTMFGMVIGGTAAIGAEAAAAVGPMIVAGAIKAWRFGQAAAMSFVLLAALVFNLHSGLGFQSVKDDTKGKRTAVQRTDNTRVAEIARIDARLKQLGDPRPVAELKASMDAILADQRAGGCKTMDGPYTKAECPKLFKLQAEHGRSVERDVLTSKRAGLVDGLMKADTVITAVDPTESKLLVYLNKLGITVEDGNLSPWSALSFVILMVIGGPLMVWVAETMVVRPQEPEAKPIIAPAQQTKPTDEQQTKVPDQVAVNNPTNNVVEIPKIPKVDGRVSPSGNRLLGKIRERGGTVSGRSQAAVAQAIDMPRTSFCRETTRLTEMGYVDLTDGNGQYVLRLIV